MKGQVNCHQLRPSGGLSKALRVISITSCTGPGQLLPSVGPGLATLPSSRVPQLPVSLCLGSTSGAGLRLTNLFCRLWWERLLPWSYLPAHKQFRRD